MVKKEQKSERVKSGFDLRKIGIILAIAVLYSIFTFATINAVYPQPEYNDYCKPYMDSRPYTNVKDPSTCPTVKGPTEAEIESCGTDEGMISWTYDEYGCSKAYKCDYCQRDLNNANEKHYFVLFIISSIFALIALLLGMYLPTGKGKTELNEWVGTGFMLGGLITLFTGTAMVYGELHRIVKPIVILAELLIVLYIAYRKLGNK
jgi:hypothetical protein